MTFLYGLLGFVGYEGLKFYKRSWDNKTLIAKTHLKAYIFAFITVGLFASVVSHLLSDGNNAIAIYIGFSLPTSAEKILSPKGSSGEIYVDDIYLNSNLKTDSNVKYSFLKKIFKIYF